MGIVWPHDTIGYRTYCITSTPEKTFRIWTSKASFIGAADTIEKAKEIINSILDKGITEISKRA